MSGQTCHRLFFSEWLQRKRSPLTCRINGISFCYHQQYFHITYHHQEEKVPTGERLLMQTLQLEWWTWTFCQFFFLLSSVLQVVNYKWVDGDDCFTRGELLRCPLYSRYIPRSYSLPIFFSLHLPLFVKIEFPILHYAKLDFLCGGNITLIESDQTEWGASLLSYI